jgi:NADH dehydrogenase FAD-containing subunit
MVETGDRREIISADTIVLAMGARANNQLAEGAADSGIGLVTVGEAKALREIFEVIREGFEEALII